MDVKELIASLAEFDEMEAPDGMNVAESVEEENEIAERKRQKRVYLAAIDAIERLRDLLEEGIDPTTGKLDPETEAWFDKLGEISGEIYSRAEAFNESLDEAEIEDGTFNDKDVMLKKISHVGIVCRANEYDNEKVINFSFVSKPQYSKNFTAPKDNEYDPKQIAQECADILKKNLDSAEDEILALLDKYGYKG